MDEYEELGHMTRSEGTGDYFIPYHPVLKTIEGRLRNSRYSEDGKHPILVSKESHLAILISRHWHTSVGNART